MAEQDSMIRDMTLAAVGTAVLAAAWSWIPEGQRPVIVGALGAAGIIGWKLFWANMKSEFREAGESATPPAPPARTGPPVASVLVIDLSEEDPDDVHLVLGRASARAREVGAVTIEAELPADALHWMAVLERYGFDLVAEDGGSGDTIRMSGPVTPRLPA